MQLLPLAGGKFVKVDDDVYEWASKMSWSFTKDGYAKAWSSQKKKHVYLHREILRNPKGMVDHQNGDKTDYQRSNLRACTNSQNQMNSKKKIGTTSIYKGVSWNSKLQKWKVQIGIDGKDYFIGYFDNERHAAYAYDLNALVLFGAFFQGNFISNEIVGRSANASL